MHLEKITSPLADIENIGFLSFAGRLEQGEKQIESEEDVAINLRPTHKDMGVENRRRGRLQIDGL